MLHWERLSDKGFIGLAGFRHAPRQIGCISLGQHGMGTGDAGEGKRGGVHLLLVLYRGGIAFDKANIVLPVTLHKPSFHFSMSFTFCLQML